MIIGIIKDADIELLTKKYGFKPQYNKDSGEIEKYILEFFESPHEVYKGKETHWFTLTKDKCGKFKKRKSLCLNKNSYGQWVFTYDMWAGNEPIGKHINYLIEMAKDNLIEVVWSA